MQMSTYIGRNGAGWRASGMSMPYRTACPNVCRPGHHRASKGTRAAHERHPGGGYREATTFEFDLSHFSVSLKRPRGAPDGTTYRHTLRLRLGNFFSSLEGSSCVLAIVR